MRGSGPFGGHSPWCCGNLQTGAIAVGFTNLVTISLLFLWFVQTLLDVKHVFISVIVSALVVFVLGVVNVTLIYGAQQRQKSLLAPWLVIYLLFQLGLLISLPLAWGVMGPLRVVAVATLLVLCYCYVVVTTYFNELKMEDDEAAKVAADADAEEAATAGTSKPTANGAAPCLIMMDDTNAVAAGHDDTFTNLMHRPAPPRNSDSASGDFALPVNAHNGNPFRQSEEKEEEERGFKASFLPKPEEVIAIDPSKRLSRNNEAPLPGLVEEAEEEQETLLGGDDDEVFMESEKPAVLTKQKSLRRQKSAADAIKAEETAASDAATFLLPRPKISNSACDVTDGGDGATSSLLQLSTVSTAAGNRSMSVSGLVDIDTSFTPFKKKGSAVDGAELPKMKIFLPQGADDDDDSDDSSSGSESGNPL